MKIIIIINMKKKPVMKAEKEEKTGLLDVAKRAVLRLLSKFQR